MSTKVGELQRESWIDIVCLAAEIYYKGSNAILNRCAREVVNLPARDIGCVVLSFLRAYRKSDLQATEIFVEVAVEGGEIQPVDSERHEILRALALFAYFL